MILLKTRPGPTKTRSEPWGIGFKKKNTSSLLLYDFVYVIRVFSNTTLTKKSGNLYFKKLISPNYSLAPKTTTSMTLYFHLDEYLNWKKAFKNQKKNRFDVLKKIKYPIPPEPKLIELTFIFFLMIYLLC